MAFNIVWGCVKISQGCDDCYAEARAAQAEDRANECSVSKSQLERALVSS